MSLSLSAIDLLIVGLIAVSAVLSLYRGFLSEFVSLAAWVVAIWVATAYSVKVAPWLPAAIDEIQFSLGGTAVQLANLRTGVAFVLLLVAVLIMGAIVNHLLSRFVLGGSLSLMDRALGLGFGVLRGGIIVVILILAAGLTRFPETPWWSESDLVGTFEPFAVWVVDQLPDGCGEYFSFGPRAG